MNQAFTMSDEIKNGDHTLRMDHISSIFLTLQSNKLDLTGFLESVQSTCKTLNSKTNLIYISQRSTQPIIEHIELLRENVLSSFLDIKARGGKTLYFFVYNYLVYFTKFEKRCLLQTNIDYKALFQQYEDKQILISPYLFMEILWRLHYDAFLAESLMYLPVDLCAEILEILPRCILMLDFSRALKFTTTIVINVYKKLDSLHNYSNASKDIVVETRKLVDNLSEIISLFNSKRFLQFKNLQKVNIHKHHGLVLKALLRMSIKCLQSESEENYQILEKYSPQYIQSLSSECFTKHREDIHALLVNLLLHKVQNIDCNCFLDWTEFDDEDQPAWSLQRAVAIECYYFLEYSQNKLSGKSYELLVQSLKQIASTPPTENTEIVDKSTLKLDTVYTDLLHDLIEFLLNKFNENTDMTLTNDKKITFLNYIKNVRSILTKLHIEQLINFIHIFVIKILGVGERHFSKLMCESYNEHLDENNYYKFNENDPLNLLFMDPERRSEQDYKRLLIRLFFRPTDTIEKIAQLAIGHGHYKLINNFSFENIDLIIDILKTPVSNAYKNLLQSLIIKARIEGEEKVNILKFNEASSKEERSTVPLAIKVFQKIAIQIFSSNQPHLSICLNTLVDKGIASVDIIVEELLIPLLLVPSCALDSILSYLQTLINVYKPQNLLYHKLLLRLLEKQPHEWCCDRYHVSKLLSQVHDLLERAFNESPYQTLAVKVSRYRYYQKIIFDNDYYLSDTFITYDVLRHELLYATEMHCLRYMDNLILKDGQRLLSKESEAEVYDVLIQIIFEACLLSLEFPTNFPPKTSDFIFNLLPVLLRITRKNDFIKVCQSLSRHANTVGLADVMTHSTFKNRWENITNTYESMCKSEKIENKDWMTFLDTLIIRDNEDLQLSENKPKAPFAVELLLREKIINYLDSKKFISKLDNKIDQCFDLSKEK